MTPGQIMEKLATARPYIFAYLVNGPNFIQAEADLQAAQRMQMDHLQYLFTLKAEGKLAIFGPLTDGGEIHGILIFNADNKEEVKILLDNDPQIKAGWTSYKIDTYFGLPGDCLP